ncbi:MAG: NapC/NirT family cytochrome c [Calditerrivibrio sp.]|nr:NapC/NirT family cytochrome c [Calditerrivibrio sp.]
MWEKIKRFMKNDPVVFVIILIVVFVAFVFTQVEVLHYTSKSEFCGKCHPEEKVGPLGEYYTWSKNVHSQAKVECIDCHGEPGLVGYMKAKVGGLVDLYGEIFKSREHKLEILTKGATDPKYAAKLVPNTTCLHCHSDEINAKNRKDRLMSIGINFRLIDNVVNPKFRESFGKVDVLKDKIISGVDPKHKTHLERGLNCVDCHLGVAHGGNKHNLPKMETCFKCHDSMRSTGKHVKSPANEDCAACHTMQVSIQQGNLIKGVDEVKWYMASLGCSDCHQSATDKPKPESCVGCHNADYAQIMIDTQKDYRQKLSEIIKKRDELAKSRFEMMEGQVGVYNQFNLIVRILEKDGSVGVHNPDYFNNLFDYANQLYEKVKNYKDEPKQAKQAVTQSKTNAGDSKPETTAKVLKANNPKEFMDMAPDTIDLAAKYSIKATKKAVVFSHKKHAEMFDCAKCHDKPEEGTLKVKITKLEGTNNSFHNELCFPCHKENKVKNGTSCTTCHK